MPEIELTGLDGESLLGYLAALGTLRVLTAAEPGSDVRMKWVERGHWTPVVYGCSASSPEELLAVLAARVCPRVAVVERKKGKLVPIRGADVTAALENANPAFREDHLDLGLPAFSELLRRASGEPKTREIADFLAALGSDCYPEKNTDLPRSTELRVIAGGNNEGFLGLMRVIHAGTDVGHLRTALFQQWDYADPPPFMRWDSNEYRPHALRANDPAGDRQRNNMRGANRLAIEALPLFPVAPYRGTVRTVACQRNKVRTNSVDVKWPIWTDCLELDTVKSLISSEDIARAGDGRSMRAGVAQVFCAMRFTEGQYRNFSPAKAVL